MKKPGTPFTKIMLSHMLWSSMISSSVSVIIGSWVSYMALCSLKWSIAVPALCASVREVTCQSRSGRHPAARAGRLSSMKVVFNTSPYLPENLPDR